MKSKKSLKVLFIGNSHTYYNDMPVMVQRRASVEKIQEAQRPASSNGSSVNSEADEILKFKNLLDPA